MKIVLAALLVSAASCAQRPQPIPHNSPTPGGYTPPALSLVSLLQTDKTLSNAVLSFASTGDSVTFRQTIEAAASLGDIGAQLMLAVQYIPEQCTFAPNRDVPACGPDGSHHPKILFRTNPLDLPASYEDACQWLERASAQGSGEASEILAQLITRMLANGHPTSYTAADSTRLHALARTQGFDVEPLSVSCFQLTPAVDSDNSGEALTFIPPQHRLLTAAAESLHPFSEAELQTLEAAGAHGTLYRQSESGGGESVILTRPEGPAVHIRVILDHAPGHEIHLPIPAHHDVIYLQHGDGFIALPAGVPALPRFLSLMPQRAEMQQVSIFVQHMDGSFGGTSCARF